MTIQRLTRNDHALQPLSATTPTGARVTKKRGRPARHPSIVPRPTSHLTANQYARLLSIIDDAGGVVTVDAISRALPQVSQPVSAVFDLCDAGILNVDWESAFDGDMHVWRIDC